MIEIDRIAEANEHIDRRARQRHAAALAQQELTPEAIKAEEERQRVNAALINGESTDDDYFTPAEDHKDAQGYRPGENPNTPEQQEAARTRLQDEMDAALQPVVDLEPNIIGIGRSVFQWMLVPSDEPENADGYQLGLQLQVDEQPPAGFVAEITLEMLEGWAKGKGLQGNRVEHKQFVSALFERAVAVGMNETGNQLVYVLEQLMLGEPTKTSVGDDEPELPEMSD